MIVASLAHLPARSGNLQMKKLYLLFSLLVIVFVMRPPAAVAEFVLVDSMDDLREAIKKATPGEVIQIVAGKYDLRKPLELKRLKGTVTHPIVI